MFTYLPARHPTNPALVVVLHGCTQTASTYDYGAGWTTLADRHGFALLFPEQQQANNPRSCFNWFQTDDTERGGGEALSIYEMIKRAVKDHQIGQGRIFVTGLSAGGAMSSVMLATYPEVFAGGAIIAGLPYRAATNVQEAFQSMAHGATRSAREWGDLVRRASSHNVHWPRISVWHGSADATVNACNSRDIIKQWINVHGLGDAPISNDVVDGHPRQAWRNARAEDVIELYTLTGMAHGTPICPGDGERQCGVPGAFLLDVGISSSFHIAKFWGLIQTPLDAKTNDVKPRGIDIGGVITRALTAVGLIKRG